MTGQLIRARRVDRVTGDAHQIEALGGQGLECFVHHTHCCRSRELGRDRGQDQGPEASEVGPLGGIAWADQEDGWRHGPHPRFGASSLKTGEDGRSLFTFPYSFEGPITRGSLFVEPN